MISLADPQDHRLGYLVYSGPGFATWYRLEYAQGEVVRWELLPAPQGPGASASPAY